MKKVADKAVADKAVAQAAKVQEQVKLMLASIFIFESPDGSRGAVIKSSPRRKGFTVGLTDLTPEGAAVIGEAVAEVLGTLIHPDAQEWVDGKCKAWDGVRKDAK